MKSLTTTAKFRREVKRMRKQGRDLDDLGSVVESLQRGDLLESRHRDHALLGNYVGSRECHISPDWLFVYRTTDDELIAERTGTHADLFD